MPTTIIRDSDGIAHIRADDVRDAFRGQGNAAAQDRLWQMEFDRRRAIGRLAEIVGPSAVDSDRCHLRLGIGRAAMADLDGFQPETIEMLDAYAAGVNEAIDALDELPPELESIGAPTPARWEPWHCVAVYKIRHLWMGTAEVKLWRSALAANIDPAVVNRMWPAVSGATVDPSARASRAGQLASVLEEAVRVVAELGRLGEDGGSNNFVLSGARTATGTPMMAGDPHRALDIPNVYWQNHLTWAGDPGGDVIGLSFAGVPGFPHFGHNRDVAWSITHGMADDQDLYLERLRRHPDGTVEARHDGAWMAVATRTETIPVAGRSDAEVDCLETVNGPLVAGSADAGFGLAMRWTATAAGDTTFDCLVPQMTARSADEIDAAFEGWVVPCNNALVADLAGTILYRFRGRLAERPSANGWTVVDGSDPSTRWSGFIADGDLWRIRNPDRGFLATANNRIGEGPYVTNDWAHPARADRLTALLDRPQSWTAADALAVLGDTHSAVAAACTRRLVELTPSAPVEQTALELLAHWDHHMDASSGAAAVYGATRAELARHLADALGTERLPELPGVGYTPLLRARALHVRIGFLVEDDGIVTDDLLAAAFRDAISRLSVELGPDPAAWRWGDVHTAGFHHPLELLRPDVGDRLAKPASVGLSGDNESIWATGTIPPHLTALTGPVARYVFDLSDWDRSGWIVPHGVTGNPRGRHFDDQLRPWASVGLAPMRFSADVVDAAAVSVVDLDPDSTS